MASPVVDRAYFGPSNLWSEKSTIEWNIRGFSSLSHENGVMVQGLPLLKCHGVSWRLMLYPRGEKRNVSEYVSVFVVAEDDIPLERDVWVKSRLVHPRPLRVSEPGKIHTSFGKDKYLNREELPMYLVDGVLTIQAELQVTEERPASWSPKKTICADMGKLLRSSEDADVTFLAEGASFPAHRLILKLRAPTLFELCEDSPPGSEVAVDKVSAAAFWYVLKFVYTDEPPCPDELRRDALELLDAADRFGCPGLKLHAESALVESGVNAENVVSRLLLADAKSCALLKEVAMDHIASNPSAVMESEDWGKVKESNDLLVEIMEVAFGKKKTGAASLPARDVTDYDGMKVSSLRRKLDDAGLSGDGTREMLVKRLKTHHETMDSSDPEPDSS